MMAHAWERMRPEEVLDPGTGANLSVQRHLITVGGAASELDKVHCQVLQTIDQQVPWSDVIGLRNKMSHGMNPNDVDPHRLREVVESCGYLFRGLPAIVVWDTPVRWKGAILYPEDIDFLLHWDKSTGGPKAIRYLAFTRAGECYSYTHASGVPGKRVWLHDTLTDKEIPDAYTGVTYTPDGVKPVGLGDGGGWGDVDPQSNGVILRPTPALLLGDPI